MSGSILVRGARQLLTLHGPAGPRRGADLKELGVIRDGAVLIRDGLIVEVGPCRRVENLAAARQAREINAAGRIVMPGLVDSHTHLVYGTPWLKDYEMRIAGNAPVQPAGGLRASVQKVHAVSGHRLEWQAGTLAAAMARHGTTTVEAKSGYGLDETGELKILRAIAALDGCPLEVASTFLSRFPAAMHNEAQVWELLWWTCTELLPRIRRRRLAEFVDISCDQPGFTLQQAGRFLEAARAQGFLLKLHADQYCHTDAVTLAVRLGAVSVDHLEQAGPDDVAALAGSATIATLLPGSAFHLGSDRYAPARALIEAGAAVALASNFNPDTCPCYNLQFALSLACTRMKMTPAEAIAAATINGAHALRRAARIGSLEVGKQADLLLLNASDYREIPYHFGVNSVHMTIKRGVPVYREGAITPPPAPTAALRPPAPACR